MNIFVLDTDKERCARYMVNRHLNKMPSEHAQMLCTAYRINRFIGHRPHNISGEEYRFLCSDIAQQEIILNGIRLYKSSYINHPCSVWVRSSLTNFLWLCELNRAIDKERKWRNYNVPGYSTLVTNELEKVIDMPDVGLTKFALAMPDQCKTSSTIRSYRRYYCQEKVHLFEWKYRKLPYWIKKDATLLCSQIEYHQKILAKENDDRIQEILKFLNRNLFIYR